MNQLTLTGNEPCTLGGVPLLIGPLADLRDADAVALIVALADIIEATCTKPVEKPAVRAEAA